MEKITIMTSKDKLEYTSDLDKFRVEFKINESDSIWVFCAQNGITISSNLKQPKILPLDSFKFFIQLHD